MTEFNDISVTITDSITSYSIIGTYITYNILTKTNIILFNGNEFNVSRDLNDFIWLNNELIKANPTVTLPKLPEVSYSLILSNEFIENRKKSLDSYLQNIILNNELVTTISLIIFLKKQDYKISYQQYFLQNVILSLLPKFLNDEKLLDNKLIEESNKPSIEIPSFLIKSYDYSILDDTKCNTHILSTKSSPNVLVIFFHGGAYAFNFMPQHFIGINEIMKQLGSCVFVLPDYPLTPKHKHHEIFNTVEDVYRKSVAKYPDLKVVLMGDSAGAGMAFLIAQRLVSAKLNNDTIRQPDSVLLLSPWLDVSCSSPLLKKYEYNDPFLCIYGLKKLGEILAEGPDPVSTIDPKVSPLYGSLQGLPPVSVWTSTHDLLSPDSHRLHERYLKEKVPSLLRFYDEPYLIHCFWFVVDFSEGKAAIKQIVDAINEDCLSKK